ncbi:hypothetical protein FRC17_006493, partial [Serendipita sp. 399]
RERSSRGTRHQQRTTAYGETLGNLELYVLGKKGIGKTTLINALLEGNEDIVAKSEWSHRELSASDAELDVMVASTTWLDIGAKKGMNNVKIHELDGFDDDGEKASDVLQPLLRSIHERFQNVEVGLSSALPASQAVTDMLASSNSPLPTALIFLLSSPPTSLELTLLSLISTHIPTITLPPYPNSLSTIPSLSSIVPRSSESTILLGPSTRSSHAFAPRPFRPRNTAELREGLFRSPKTLRVIRQSAVERFEHWREIRKACEDMGLGSWVSPSATVRKKFQDAAATHEGDEPSRRRKLAWELRLSQDVAMAFNTNNNNREQLEERKTKKGKLAIGSEEALANLEEGGEQFFSASSEGGGMQHEDSPLRRKELGIKDESSRELDIRDMFLQNELMGGDPDPLHLPTLFRLSTALLGALGKRLVSSLVVKNPPNPLPYEQIKEEKGSLAQFKESAVDDHGSWSLSKWGIAGIAFAIGFYAGRILSK